MKTLIKNGHFIKDIWIQHKHKEGRLTSLIAGERQIKISEIQHMTPKPRTLMAPGAGEAVGPWELAQADRNAEMPTTQEDGLAISLPN